MFRVQTLNQIAEKGLQVFTEERYEVGDRINHPDGILLRSYSLHQEEFSKDLKAIARAGAGVNNIPVERCTEKGIVVFNTPGANANAVKELIIASLIMSSRNIINGVSWTKNLEGEEVPQLVESGKKTICWIRNCRETSRCYRTWRNRCFSCERCVSVRDGCYRI